jgi:hypothetical protein
MKLLAVGLMVLCASGADAGSTLVGPGSQTCTAWTNREKNPVVKGSFESWLVGFISGLNVSWERDMIGGGDFDSIVAWMDTRRRATPSDRIGIAALDLGMELARRDSATKFGYQRFGQIGAPRPRRVLARPDVCSSGQPRASGLPLRQRSQPMSAVSRTRGPRAGAA